MSLKVEPPNTVYYIITTGDEKADLERIEQLGFSHNYDSTFSPMGDKYRAGLILYIYRPIYYPEIMTIKDFDKIYRIYSDVYNIISVEDWREIIGTV